MGLPPVLVGLVVYLLLSKSGPLASLDWLFTPSAMVLAQVLLCLPLVIGITAAAVSGILPAEGPLQGRKVLMVGDGLNDAGLSIDNLSITPVAVPEPARALPVIKAGFVALVNCRQCLTACPPT